MSDEQVPQLIDTSVADATTNPSSDSGINRAANKVVPVTIITGYLGSGKSTLLRHITGLKTGKRIAIILNEFGDSADIERSLTVTEKSTEIEEWLELDNGCMCCTAKDAGVAAIEKLMQRKGQFDYVLLETSGLADPAPIANMFWLDEPLMASLKLDGVITVVDASNISRSLNEGPVAGVQIAAADVVIINKCDTASESQLAEAQDQIQRINGACDLIKCQFGEVNPELILDLNAYENNAKVPDHISSSNAKGGHGHDSSITTLMIPLSQGSKPLTDEHIDRIEAKLQHLLWEKEIDHQRVDVYRVKGRIVGSSKTYAIQGVRETYEITPIDRGTVTNTKMNAGDAKDSKLVLIGKGLGPVKDTIFKLFT